MNLFGSDALSQVIRSHVLLILVTLLTVPSTSYASLLYSVDRGIGEGHMQGTITTNGKIGILDSTDFVDWSLTVFDLSHSTIFTPLNSRVVAANVIGTFEDLSIDFTDKTDSAYFSARWGSTPGYGWVFEHHCDVTQFCQDDERIVTWHNPIQQYVQQGLTGHVSFAVAQIPEPSTLGLLGVGVGGIIARRLRHNHRLSEKGARLDYSDSSHKSIQPTRYTRCTC